MPTVRRKANEVPPLTPDERTHLMALAEIQDGEIDFSDNPEWTEEDWACATRTSDYPSRDDALEEADHLAELRDAGMAIEEIRAYKESRIGRLATV